MAISFPEQPELVNSSENMQEKLMTLSDSWQVYANMQQHIVFMNKLAEERLILY